MERYKSRGVLVDTSLLLVLYVGIYDPDQVERFNRTRRIGGSSEVFTRRDFEYILSFVDQFERVTTTPHILTEVSNFLGQLKGDASDGSRTAFARHVASSATQEYSPDSELLTGKPEFIPLGLTDTSIIEVAAEPYLVFTTDYKLHGILTSKGIPAFNYNHCRPIILNQ